MPSQRTMLKVRRGLIIFTTCLMAVNFFLLGALMERNTNSKGQGKTNVAVGMQRESDATLKAKAKAANATYKEFMANPAKPIGNAGNMERFARAICYRAITHQELCESTPIKIAETPGALGITSMSFYKELGKISAKITFDPKTLSFYPKKAEFMIAHEWNHAEIGAIAGNYENFSKIEARANAYYRHRDGSPMEGSDGGEILTDCLTYSRSKVSWDGPLPSYLVNATTNMSGGASVNPGLQAICRNWAEILYGLPEKP